MCLWRRLSVGAPSYLVVRLFEKGGAFASSSYTRLRGPPFVSLSVRLASSVKMAIGKSFLDQYSVICVFGSVVGCVVVPLIAQVREIREKERPLNRTSFGESKRERRTFTLC